MSRTCLSIRMTKAAISGLGLTLAACISSNANCFVCDAVGGCIDRQWCFSESRQPRGDEKGIPPHAHGTPALSQGFLELPQPTQGHPPTNLAAGR